MKLKTTLATTLSLGLLATTAATVAAQTDESPSGTYFSGVMINEDVEWSGTAARGILEDALCGPDDEPAGIIVDDIASGAVIEATDPRISGVMEESYSVLSCYVDGQDVASAFWVEYRITNDDGSWSGGGPGYITRELEWEDPRALAFFHTMTGEGAYEGLTAVFLRQRNAWAEDGPPTHMVNGVIVAGDIPAASDFEGSLAASEGLVPDPRFTFDEIEPVPGDDFGFGTTGAGVVLDEALGVAGEALGIDWGFRIETLPETMVEILEWESEDPDWVARMTNALEAIGVAPEDTSVHIAAFAPDVDPVTFEPAFQLAAVQYHGADPAALREWFHPDNTDGPDYVEDRPPGTTAEELRFGEHTVYAAYVDGAPIYTLIEGEVTLEIEGPQGWGSEPDPAAVQAFFEALPNLAELE